MYQEFTNIESLLEAVKCDKSCITSDRTNINRYPLRFVLFDNFNDAKTFMDYMSSQDNIQFKNVQDWLDVNYPDTLISSTKLATSILNFVLNNNPVYDYIVSPFSELSRFYNHNKISSEFNTLVRTIKGIEASIDAQKNSQRIYIPVIGQEGKFEEFKDDIQMTLWYQKNLDVDSLYKLILTNDTIYNIANIEKRCTMVDSVTKWLDLWRNPNTNQIIFSTSPSLYINAEYAQPDNAFKIYKCDNAYQVLTNGLNLKFGEVEYLESDNKFWNELASKIDIIKFSFQEYCNKYFGIYDLADYTVFINAWFDFTSEYDRWLLTKYYLDKFCNLGYLCQALRNMQDYSTREMIREVVFCIFDCEDKNSNLEERTICLREIASHKETISQSDEDLLVGKLEELGLEIGYSNAIKYMSSLSKGEKKLLIKWFAEGKIEKEFIRECYPELYNYLLPMNDANPWLSTYISQYKTAKIRNVYDDEMEVMIKKINSSPLDFDKWYQDFKTVPTLLSNHSEIDVFYWIDGLGIDWIPYILNYIEERGGIYVNEVYIGRSMLPTVTSINKDVLKEMADKMGKPMEKIGDLDEFGHKSTNSYPDSIIEELQIVKESIDRIINQYADKTIAIVSDHGMTSLAQLCDSINLSGYSSDHQGRCANYESGQKTQDNNYFSIPNGNMICALTHHSVCRKTPTGQNAHGGCTPEEVLIPIFILSSKKHLSKYTVKLFTKQLSGMMPLVFDIKGVSLLDNIKVVYANKIYDVSINEKGTYETKPIAPILGENSVEIKIGEYSEKFSIKVVIMGLEEDDMGI